MTTSRALCAGSRERAKFIEPADEPRDDGIKKMIFIMSITMLWMIIINLEIKLATEHGRA